MTAIAACRTCGTEPLENAPAEAGGHADRAHDQLPRVRHQRIIGDFGLYNGTFAEGNDDAREQTPSQFRRSS